MAKQPSRGRGRTTPKGTRSSAPKGGRIEPQTRRVDPTMPAQGRAFVARPMAPRSGHRGRR